MAGATTLPQSPKSADNGTGIPGQDLMVQGYLVEVVVVEQAASQLACARADRGRPWREHL